MEKGKAQNSRKRKGVSPVIGVILMVAATIVIAAVVIAMLGGFQQIQPTYLVTATATSDVAGTTIYVTYNGGPDTDMLDNCTLSGLANIDQFDTPTPVGDIATGDGTPGSGNDQVIVVANFVDGTSQVILNTFV